MVKKSRFAIALIVSIIALGAIVSLVVCCYWFLDFDRKILWIPLILSILLFEAVCGLVMFSRKVYSDENKAFWLFIILILPLVGCIFWLFMGRGKQKGYAQGKSSQATLLAHLFKAEKSIKIYTNSFFISSDTIKALNYASWKDLDIKIVLSFDKKKWKQKLLKYDINKLYESKVTFYFNNKEIEHNFIIIDDKEVLFSKDNFNYKNMYCDSKIYLAQDYKSYISLWDRDFIRSSQFKHNHDKVSWTKRLKNGILNIFYPFY